MRIPVFRSEAQATNEAPGASIRARMDPNVFVQAELRKGDVFTETMKQVGDYALVRAKAEAEVQYNEAMLAAEEEMRSLAESLKESGRLGDVINEKGTGSWQVQTTDMRERLADGLSSRSMTDAFNARFNQQELTLRFQLRDAIESRIKARAAAAASARQEKFVAEMSNPYTPIEKATMLYTSHSAEIDASVANGIMTSEMRSTVDTNIVRQIAENTVSAYVFDDPTRANAFAEALDLQDEINAGTMTAEEAYEQSGLDPDGAYTLFTLQLLPRDEALEIIYDTLGKSNRLFEAQEKERERVDKANDSALSGNYKAMFMFADSSETFTKADVMVAAPDVAAVAFADLPPDAPITSQTVRQAFETFFNQNNYLSPTQRKEIETAFGTTNVSRFGTTTNQDILADLNVLAGSGQLTLTRLNVEAPSLTSTDYISLANNIGTASNTSLSDAVKRVTNYFRIDEAGADDSDAAKIAKRSYNTVLFGLNDEFNKRQSEGNPMTRTEITTLANTLIDSQRDAFVGLEIEARTAYIQFSMTNIPDIGEEDPLADLDAWYSSLPDVEKQNVQQDYSRHRYVLQDFKTRIGR